MDREKKRSAVCSSGCIEDVVPVNPCLDPLVRRLDVHQHELHLRRCINDFTVGGVLSRQADGQGFTGTRRSLFDWGARSVFVSFGIRGQGVQTPDARFHDDVV